MNQQTQQTKTAGTHSSQKEEGRHMTTKSAAARSSITDTHRTQKNIIDAEEQQRRTMQDESERLTVDCRISADASILTLISKARVQNQIGMLMETTAKAARSILLRAADSVGHSTEPIDTACMEIHLRFTEPGTLFQIRRREDADVIN